MMDQPVTDFTNECLAALSHRAQTRANTQNQKSNTLKIYKNKKDTALRRIRTLEQNDKKVRYPSHCITQPSDTYILPA